MKVLFLVFGLIGFSAQAATEVIESNLQATVLSAQFPKAVKLAKAAVAQVGSGYVATFGETFQQRTDDGPGYFYYIPVFAVKVPLSPKNPVNVGNIVAKLQNGLNEPIPYVEAVYFAPAPELPVNRKSR
jgi:hypothetical protein